MLKFFKVGQPFLIRGFGPKYFSTFYYFHMVLEDLSSYMKPFNMAKRVIWSETFVICTALVQ